MTGDRCTVPTRDTPPPLPADLVAWLSDAHAVWTSLADQRNSLPSRSMRWRMTESLRAMATVAFLVPILLARRVPRPSASTSAGHDAVSTADPKFDNTWHSS